jgi:pimeloyl-ACP methyl ester carboxylesterase
MAATLQREIRFCTGADGVQLATASCGSGPPLLKAATWLTHLEHAPAGSLARGLIDAFGRSHTYIEYDTRGCGLSQRRVDEISFEAWVSDLERVADAYRLDRFALMGITCAAGVAVAYAARHPERVSHLVLFGGFATSYHSTTNPDPAVRREGDTLLQVAEVGWGSDSPAFRQVFVAKFLPNGSAEQWRAFDALQRATATPDVAVRHLRAMYAMNVKEAAARVRCPTLVFHPRGDQMVRFEQGRRLAALIPGARFVPLASDNHTPTPGEPAWDEFVHETRAFLADHAAAATHLTQRQLDVLKQVARGQSDKQIARALSLSPRTVEMHVSGALKALGCRTRAEATHRAAQQGLL